MASQKNALVRYINWLKEFNPVLYAAVKVTRPDIFNALKARGMGYLAADEPVPWYTTALNTVTEAVKAFVPIYQQKVIFSTQMDRIKNGLPPLSNEAIAQAGTTHIQVDLPADIKDQVLQTAQTAQSGINWGVMGLLVGGGILLWTMTQPKRRRR